MKCQILFSDLHRMSNLVFWVYKDFFQKKKRFDISYKLSLVQTICMKCQILFSMKYKKKCFSMLSTEFAQRFTG